jgi:hypothetical protein
MGWPFNFKNMEGAKFGRLTPRWPSGKYKCGAVLWLCSCDCGGYTVVMGSSLRLGKIRSCGCLQKEHSLSMVSGVKPLRYKHGHATRIGPDKTNTNPTYVSWCSMNKRCYDPKDKGWPRYGGRGITVCDRWRGEHGFENFLFDMGERPKDKTLDRFPNHNSNYEPSNCRWATALQQNHNRGISKDKYMVEAAGDPTMMTASDGYKWAREFISMSKTNSLMAVDVGIMATWFNAAIKAGMDQVGGERDELVKLMLAVNDQMERRMKNGTMLLIQ